MRDGIVTIVDYSPEHHDAFRQMNVDWLERYNLMESHDMLMLDNPQSTVIDRGGFIWIAIVDGKIVGSSAIVKEGEGEYELAKMAVIPEYQGRGISRLLIEKSLNKAKQAGAHRVTLFSNHQLTNAISLYEKYGFRHIPVEGSPFATADVKMELLLDSKENTKVK